MHGGSFPAAAVCVYETKYGDMVTTGKVISVYYMVLVVEGSCLNAVILDTMNEYQLVELEQR